MRLRKSHSSGWTHFWHESLRKLHSLHIIYYEPCEMSKITLTSWTGTYDLTRTSSQSNNPPTRGLGCRSGKIHLKSRKIYKSQPTIINYSPYGLQHGHFHKSLLIPKIKPRKTTLKAATSCLLDFLPLSWSVERINRWNVVNFAMQKQELLKPDPWRTK